MLEDVELLRQYAGEKSEGAFIELVQRHVNYVYAAALRRLGGNVHLAKDVTQHVFTALALEASSLAQHPVLSGWLYATTRNAAVQVVRTERRRILREQAAQSMHELTSSSPNDAEWERLRPVLDGAMDELGDADRQAVLLRFFEGKSFAEVGVSLHLTENTARMRVDRALDKLHGLLARRGVTSTAAALGMALVSQASVAAPTGLGAAVALGALTSVASGGSALALGASLLTMSKIKIGIVGVIIATVVATGIVEFQTNRALSAELGSLRNASIPPARVEKEQRELNAALQKLTQNIPEAEELTRLRRRAAGLKARPPGVVDSEMKPSAVWMNRGWTTPEAALETVLWAGSVNDREVLVSNARFVGPAKAPAEAAFASLPEVVRAKYGTADRLLGMVGYASRGPAGDEADRKIYGGRVLAYQLLDTSIDLNLGGINVRWWETLDSGEERETKHTFVRDGDRFTLGINRFLLPMWEGIISQVDFTTGELLPKTNPGQKPR